MYTAQKMEINMILNKNILTHTLQSDLNRLPIVLSTNKNIVHILA